MEPLHKQRNPDLIMDPNILLSASISYDEMGKYERYTRMITSLIPLTKSLAQQKRDRHTKSLGIRYIRVLVIPSGQTDDLRNQVAARPSVACVDGIVVYGWVLANVVVLISFHFDHWLFLCSHASGSDCM
ncbi:hypothetical protein V6N11_033490 [Hibiscus sabdariffa]|uniref:PIN domain-containing protein n=1 Tax=Hibiscus sabdariffa TaxID=183260 RepID=A0ABR2PYA8_9ROSI